MPNLPIQARGAISRSAANGATLPREQGQRAATMRRAGSPPASAGGVGPRRNLLRDDSAGRRPRRRIVAPLPLAYRARWRRNAPRRASRSTPDARGHLGQLGCGGLAVLDDEQVERAPPGPSGPSAAHWKRAASRVRRWDMPTTLAPASFSTSPGRGRRSTPGRTTVERTRPPRWTVVVTPSSPSAACQASPSQRNASPTSTSQSGSLDGSEHVDPEQVARHDEHGPSPAAAPHDLDAGAQRRRRGRRPRRAGRCRAPALGRSASHTQTGPLRREHVRGVERSSRGSAEAHDRPSPALCGQRGRAEVRLPVLGHGPDGHDHPGELAGSGGPPT